MTAAACETDELARRFCERTLPKAEWTHCAHIRVGLWHLLKHGEEPSLGLLREGIKEYNLAVGGENTDTGGYHETITRFYVWLIARFLENEDRTLPIDELAHLLLARYGARDVPLRYFSKERLMSVEARRAWIEPDLRPLALDLFSVRHRQEDPSQRFFSRRNVGAARVDKNRQPGQGVSQGDRGQGGGTRRGNQ